jgi:hypothetical protein
MAALAEFVLVLHVAFVFFVVGGLFLILTGGMRGWKWIRNPWFRSLHLGGIGLVIVQAWCGIVCPLTTLEMFLRETAGQSAYGGTFVSYWLHRLIYFQAPGWVFSVCYTAFGCVVIFSWMKFRPRSFTREGRGA